MMPLDRIRAVSSESLEREAVKLIRRQATWVWYGVAVTLILQWPRYGPLSGARSPSGDQGVVILGRLYTVRCKRERAYSSRR